jgi:hypothetical protein
VHREWLTQNIAVAIATKRDMFALGIIEGNAEHFSRITGSFKDSFEKLVLVAVDGLCKFNIFHGIMKMPLFNTFNSHRSSQASSALRARPSASDG